MNGFRLACTIALCLGAAAPLHAEVYLWADAAGRVHMADDLTQVPSAARARARQDAVRAAQASRTRFTPSQPALVLSRPGATSGGRSPSRAAATLAAPLQNAPEREAAEPPAPVHASFRSDGGGRHVLTVEADRRELRVQGEIGGVSVPFVIDSGSQACTLPTAIAAQLGLVADENTPAEMLYGLGKEPVRAPYFVIDELRIGDLVVENLKVHVIDRFAYGLLGMPFLNQFRVESDPARGTLTLESL